MINNRLEFCPRSANGIVSLAGEKLLPKLFPGSFLHFASTIKAETRTKRNRQIEADQIKSDEIFMETSLDGSCELPLESISGELECMSGRKRSQEGQKC
jgi:hypothetical protein